ncbi:MAG TPA: hypothetical protein PKX23_11775 [Verrucomicrobiota bacterium]|nr:hypothetical protein [Verrucomicrobiota bacterium]HRT08500.1 hypothetical protein [Candidatus Paceibacterota bacterium]HRT57756.1 hypothetical protein [Candidatus Paceibacterota bacterium]
METTHAQKGSALNRRAGVGRVGMTLALAALASLGMITLLRPG